MDPWSAFLGRFVLPRVAQLQGDHSYAFAREAQRMLEWDRDRIEVFQWNRTREMIRYAESKSRFHRRRFAEYGVSARDIKDPSDLKRLPVLTKRDLRESLDEIMAEGIDESSLVRAYTGGSTDSPTLFYRDQRCTDERNGWTHAFRRWFGWRPGHRVAWVWGAPQDLPDTPSVQWQLRQRYIERQVFLPCWKLNDSVFQEMIRQLRGFQPHIISAYPTPLALLGEHMLSYGVNDIRPTSVVLTAEPVYEAQRESIERAFGCPVFSFYGSREIGMAAAECREHSNLHYNALGLFLEFDAAGRDVGPGEMGRILVTDLENRATPLIRYEIGDAGTPDADSCPCGSGLPKMAFSGGRDTDVLVSTDGTLIPGVTLTNRVVQHSRGIAAVQILQEEVDSLHVSVVKGSWFQPDDERQLAASLRSFVGSDVQIEFAYVDKIPRSSSGKHRFCISKVGSRALRGEDA